METYNSLEKAKKSGVKSLLGTINYLEDFLAKPHPSLISAGHLGSVCPFTPTVLRMDTISFVHAVLEENEFDKASYFRNIVLPLSLCLFYRREEGMACANKKTACTLVVLDGISTEDECNLYISQIQKEEQPNFVEKGLLLSELHPFSKVPSVRSNVFFPSRTPYPIFFIRRIIPNDIPYLLRKDRYEEDTYNKILFSLKRDFGIGVITREMTRLCKEVDWSGLLKCRFRGGACECKTDSKIQGFGFLCWEEVYRFCLLEDRYLLKKNIPLL
jgi:hypothetical protein